MGKLDPSALAPPATVRPAPVVPSAAVDPSSADLSPGGPWPAAPSPAAPSAAVRSFYAGQSEMSDPGGLSHLFDGLGDDVDELARVLQGLVIYDVVAEPFYGVTVPPARTDEIHLRGAAAMLARIVQLDGRLLAEPRPPDRRLVGRCHHFALLLVSMLRAGGIPARLRGGFGAWFNAPQFEDHWIAEYWSESQRRWVTPGVRSRGRKRR